MRLSTESGLGRVIGLTGMLNALPAAGRAAEAIAIAEETLAVARAHGCPYWITWALAGYGRAFAETDPARALTALRQGLVQARESRCGAWEANIARDAAALEAAHGDIEQALVLYDDSLDALHRAGNVVNVAATLANLAVLFDRMNRPETAAITYGACTNQPSTVMVINLPRNVDDLRARLGETRFEQCVAIGMAMELGEAVHYARQQIHLARLAHA